MGCTASKLDNEDTVRRCKERRRLMKEAVYSRHHLAAAHSDYCRSLRVTGSALVAFASGEPFSVSEHSPAVLLRTPTATKLPTSAPPPHRRASFPSPSPSIHPPPPPPPMSTASSHKPPPPPRRKKSMKLPHILSDSSFTSSPPPNPNFAYNARANSTFSATPSQTSSVWNWDNFYPPPSPPDSEFFEQLHSNNKNESPIHSDHSDDDDHRYIENRSDDKASNSTFNSNVRNPDHQHQNPIRGNDGSQFDDRASNSTFISNVRNPDHQHQNPIRGNDGSQFDDRASNFSSYSRYSKNYTKKSPEPEQNWESEEDEETEREEVHCSEWGDHDNCSSTSSSSSDDGEEEELKSRSDFGTRSDYESVKKVPRNVNVNAKSKFSSISEKPSSEEDGKSSVSWGNGNGERRIVVRHKDLAEIVAALGEYFDKAASAGEQVTQMLEAGRDQMDQSFKQLRKTVYHSSGMLSTLSSSWTSKPPLTVKYRFEPSSIEQTGGQKSLCSTLERLLAWEKKLYQEVKAREGVKIENERKLSALQGQEFRGEEETKLDKTKASIKRLQSLTVVTSQAVSTTSSAIIGLRDSDLIPQLVELCHGFMYMWRSMNQYHEIQNDIVQQVRGLVNHTMKFESTSDLHRQATRDLVSAVSAWHSKFCHLIKFQRDFVRSLHAWFKLTLVPTNIEPTNGTNSEQSEVFTFFDEWKLALDRVPDTVASEAIKSFNNVVHTISLKQTEELKIKKRTESASKEFEKKASSIRNLEKKYYHSYSMVGIGMPDPGPDNGHVLDARDPLAEKKTELATCERRVEDEMVKHTKAVEVTRAMTLNNIQTGLPGVFQAMSSFSAMITEALQTVCTRSYAI